jgi:histidine phosphotransferase ChpT
MPCSLQLAELVCARVGHDLGGLLGSLTGLLELVAEDPDNAQEEMALATTTVSDLALRLRLVRAAWGGTSEELEVGSLQTWVLGLVGSHKVNLDLHGLVGSAVLPAPMARLVLNVIMLAGEALPGGGVLALSGDPQHDIVAQIAGPSAAWPTGFARCIANETQAWAALSDARTLQGPLTALIARKMGFHLSFLMGIARESEAPPLLLARHRIDA